MAIMLFHRHDQELHSLASVSQHPHPAAASQEAEGDMEKYSRWADLSTGINPFVPHQPRLSASLPLKGAQLLGGSALALLRLPLVLVAGLATALVAALSSLLTVVPLLGRLLQRVTDWLLCSLLLLLLGVFVGEEEANTRRLGLTSAAASRSNEPAKRDTRVRRGDVIVCNHTSFLEVLVLAKRFSPTFVFVSEESGSKGLVGAYGLTGAVFRAFAAPLGALDASSPKIENVVKNARGPVVVFAEGARSNGKSVLSFVPVLQRLPVTTRVHLVAFRFEFKNFSPSQSAGGGWRHYFATSFRPYHSLKMTVLSAGDLDLAAEFKAAKTLGATTITDAQVNKMRGLLAAMLRTKTVELGVKDFVSFNAYWSHVRGGGKRPASEFTDRKAPHEHAQWTKR